MHGLRHARVRNLHLQPRHSLISCHQCRSLPSLSLKFFKLSSKSKMKVISNKPVRGKEIVIHHNLGEWTCVVFLASGRFVLWINPQSPPPQSSKIKDWLAFPEHLPMSLIDDYRKMTRGARWMGDRFFTCREIYRGFTGCNVQQHIRTSHTKQITKRTMMCYYST